jgi:hypothetical protein
MKEEQGTIRGKAGRPRKGENEKVQNYPVMVYMPNAEAFEMVREAAEREGLSISGWARSVLLNEAKKLVGKKG